MKKKLLVLSLLIFPAFSYGATIDSYPEKTSVVDADLFIIADSADSNAVKRVQRSNLGLKAAGVPLADADGYYTATEVESAFAEAYESLILKAPLASPTFTGTVTAGAAGFTVDADGDVIAKSVTVSGTDGTRGVGLTENTTDSVASQTVHYTNNVLYWKNESSTNKTFAFLDSNITGTASNVSGTPALPDGTTATTQSQSDNSTKLATTAYVDTGLADEHDAVTIGTANGLSLSTQEISLAAATSSTPGAATAAQITALEAVDTEAEVEGLIFDADNTGNLLTTGTLQGAMNIVTKATSATLTATEVTSSFILVTGAATLTLPTAAAGYSACAVSGQGSTAIIQIAPATGDYLVVDGVRGTAATAYASSGAAGDKICFISANADDWYVTSTVGTWSE